jgi:H+/Cl- antiporter ClcA
LLSWLLVKKYAGYAKGSGIPQVMAAVELATPKYQHQIKKLLSLRIIAVKIASSICMVFGGGVIGREGPTIQIAGSVFRIINEWLPSWWPKISKRNMIMAGAGAGLAAAFNTPLGGIVFTVEELTKTHISFFKTALLTAVLIAGLTAQSLLGPYLYLGYPDVSNLSKWIFLPVIFAAIISGLAGSIMSKVILGISRWKAAFKNSRRQVVFIIVCAILLVCLSYFVNQKAFGSGKDIMTRVLFTSEKNLPWYMPLLRIMSQVISFTTGAAGGVFAPALSAGCCVGSVIAEWFQLSATNTNLLVLAEW